MGKSQRRKGMRGEREFVEYLETHGFKAEKISAMYRPGADVIAFGGRLIEIKRRANPVSQLLTNWLRDVNMVAVRTDYDVWHVWITLDEMLDLIEDQSVKEE